MKRITLLLTGLSLLALTGQAQTQDEYVGRRNAVGGWHSESPAWRNDPTYSTHNYKHANKAAAARRWETKPGVVVQQPAPADADVANYKRQVPNQPPVGGIAVNHTPSANLASRNYKMQQPGRVSESVPNNVAKRKADTTALGD